jgi:uncharacterized repeat protein (TIGR01451 family)
MKPTIVRTCALAATLLIVIGAQREGHAQKSPAPARAGTAARAVKLPSHAGLSIQDLLKKRRGADLGDPRLSPMGQLAYLAGTGQLHELIDEARSAPDRSLQVINQRPVDDEDDDDNGDDDEGEGPPGGQAELSIAVDSTGMHIVVGMNDTRGFALNPLSVSGFAYSDDGGATFVDGGQLPSPGTDLIGTMLYPQVFGDPEVKYLGGSNFVFFSIMVTAISATGAAQTMGVHRSTDFGHTWSGPFEIPSATNPHGLLSGDNARDAADKEFADVDPETGRVMMSWSNFTSTAFAPGGVEISTTFSDDIMTATPPTWSPRQIVAATLADGQASIPRFAAGSSQAYVAWRRFPGGNGQNVGFAASTDNGATWSAPINTTTNFFTMDQVVGNDRVNTSPSLAVDTSLSATRGNIYLVYSNNNTRDGADVSFQRSLDGGLTFSAPVAIDSRPGADRAQWFPWVTVDTTTGRVHVCYYDQGIATSGDVTENTCQFSNDAGLTWSRPAPVTDRPFHAGYGNDTGQPNIGDYNQAVAQGGELFVVWAGNPNIVSFTDGQPSTSFSVPDIFFKRTSSSKAALRLGTVTFVDGNGNGFVDAGEQVSLKLPLENYVTNPLNATAIAGISATLSTTTPGITVMQSSSAYGPAAPGGSTTNATDYVIKLSSAFVPATHIELALDVTSSDGTTTLLHTLSTGTPQATVLLSENFDGVSAPELPAGWVTSHAGGTNTVPWVTSDTFNAGNNGAFHQNAADGPGPGTITNTRFERLFSPSFVVPADSDYVTVDFDTKYDTEDDPAFNILAYDGYTLRVTDLTVGRTLRSNLAEAFAEEFTTGSLQHQPKHLPRNANMNYFQDMSVWAGDSGGMQHVHLKLPGMAGSTAQLRFEFTQDAIAICSDLRPGHTCGVLVDNLVVASVAIQQADLLITKTAPATLLSGSNVTYTLVAKNNGIDPARNTATGVMVSDALPAGTTFVSSSATAGWTCTTPAPGSGGTFSCSKMTMAPGETATFTLVVNVACATPNGTIIANTAAIAASAPPDPDSSNNSSTAMTTVSNPPPTIGAVSTNPSQLWPPNHKMVDIAVNYSLSDNCGPVTTSLSVSSNEPVNGSGDGNTAVDWVVVDAHHVQLRAERAGGGTGRIYTITIKATDSAGNSSTQTVTVVVPHN